VIYLQEQLEDDLIIVVVAAVAVKGMEVCYFNFWLFI